MAETRTTIINPSGLPARPAARFIEVTSSFKSDVLVKNITTDFRTANAKSILGILTLGVESRHEILISAFGEDEQQACNTLADLVADELVMNDHPGSD